MKITGNPFDKHSYGEERTWRNALELVACMAAARRLGLKFSFGTSLHASYMVLNCRECDRRKLEEKVIAEAGKFSGKEILVVVNRAKKLWRETVI